MNLGENIYTFRTVNNMSQGGLANALEVSRQSVSKWENNSAVPELDKLVKMSKLFGVTLDELVNGPAEPNHAANQTHGFHFPPTRIMAGSIMLLFGMVFFLLSIFWGQHLRFGEEIGEFASVCIVLLSISLLATYNHKILAICAIIYMAYAAVAFGIFHVNTLSNYFFLSFTGIVLLVWFLTWGMDASIREGGEEPAAEEAGEKEGQKI